MSRSDTQVNIRIPPDMRKHIQKRAEVNRRSMNSEIVHYLDCALKAQEAKGPASVDAPPSHNHDQSTQKDQGNDA